MGSMGASSAEQPVEFTFFASCDLNLQVQVRVDQLVGCLPVYREPEVGDGTDSGVSRPWAVFVEGQLCCYGEPLGIPARTSWAEASTSGASWEGWLAFPIKYRDLGHDAQLALTVWGVHEGVPRHALGGTTLRLFSKKGRLKTGRQDLQLWPGRPADTRWPSSTPGKVPVAQRGELGRVEGVLKRYNRGEVEHVDWLDRLALRAVEELRERERRRLVQEAELAAAEGMYGGAAAGAPGTAAGARGITSSGTSIGGDSGGAGGGDSVAWHLRLQLQVELPSFPRAVIYQQASVAVAGHSAAAGSMTGAATSASTADALSTPLPGTSGRGVAAGPSQYLTSTSGAAGSLILLHDSEVGRENPAEAKAAKLARSLTRGLVDKRLKPDTEERRRIEAVLEYPPNRPLSAEDKALLWRFRYALTSEPRALTKFLKCVDWSDASEARQAAELAAGWAPIGVADALELLSPDFTNEEVRGHAVEVLQKTDDEELLYYLLPLVQALRYEPSDESRLAAFLISRARRSITVASFLFWYLLTELADDTFGPRAALVQSAIMGASGQQASPTEECIHQQVQLVARLKHISETVSSLRGAAAKKTEALRALLSPGGVHADLATFACPCPLDPSVHLLGLVPSQCGVFKSAMNPLRLTFRARLPGGSSVLATGSGSGGEDGSGSGGALHQSHEPVGRMASLTLASQLSMPSPDGTRLSAGGAGSRRQKGAGGAVAQPGGKQQQWQHGTIPPSPAVHEEGEGQQPGSAAGIGTSAALGVVAGQHTSAAAGDGSGTASASASASGGGPEASAGAAVVTLIYKRGDDLRQDQLVVQMVSLMDRLLKREHLDLRITPYQVLATSCTDGLIEFVPSQPLARVLADYRSIHRFLAMHHPDPTGPFGLSGEVLSTFVKSCAGYCVMTYVLGVGDRHLDNLMLTPDGRLFHIDFGYILGRDPKPFPPPMKLCKEMVDAMGGQDSQHYRQFKTYCCEAYNILRKSAHLLLNLFHLMSGASIPDIQGDPQKALLKLQERLRPDLRDEEAALWMTQVLADSASALMPQVMEKAHQWAQYWR